ERHTDVTTHLELGHAHAIAPALQSEGVVVDVLTYLRRVPSLLRGIESCKRVLERIGIASQLRGEFSLVVVGCERPLDVVVGAPESWIILEAQRLLISQDGAAQVVGGARIITLGAEAGEAGVVVSESVGDECIRLSFLLNEVVGKIPSSAELFDRLGTESGSV